MAGHHPQHQEGTQVTVGKPELLLKWRKNKIYTASARFVPGKIPIMLPFCCREFEGMMGTLMSPNHHFSPKSNLRLIILTFLARGWFLPSIMFFIF
jgi:hypothetical protein